MTDTTINNTFYLTFKNENPSWSLIGCASIVGIIALFGIILNFSVIYVTIRTKALRGTVNYLLALCSLFELLHQQGHFLFVYTAFSGQNFIEFRLATKLIFVSAFGLGGIYPTMFFTGIDRLIGIIFDEMQNTRKIRLYLSMLTIFCCMVGLNLCYTFYQNMSLYGDQMITGTIADFFKGYSYEKIIRFCTVLMTSVVYLIVGFVIKKKTAGLPSADQINHRAFRALICIVSVNFGGYCIYLFYTVLINPTISSPITAWFLQLIAAIPLNIGAASNGPILYFTSTEYRQAFQAEFSFVFKGISNQNQVEPQPNVVAPNH